MRSGWISADRGRNDIGVRGAKFAAFGRRALKMSRPLPGLRRLPISDALRDRRRPPVFALRSSFPVGFGLVGWATFFLPWRDLAKSLNVGFDMYHNSLHAAVRCIFFRACGSKLLFEPVSRLDNASWRNRPNI